MGIGTYHTSFATFLHCDLSVTRIFFEILEIGKKRMQISLLFLTAIMTTTLSVVLVPFDKSRPDVKIFQIAIQSLLKDTDYYL